MELRLSCTNPSRWSCDSFIFIMEIPILWKTVFILQQALQFKQQIRIHKYASINLWSLTSITVVEKQVNSIRVHSPKQLSLKQNLLCITQFIYQMRHLILDILPTKWFAWDSFNIKMLSCQYRNTQCKDKTVSWPSFLYTGNGESVYLERQSLYWNRAQRVVSLMFLELFRIFSWNLCIAEIALLMRILSWNFARVPKAMLWAHTCTNFQLEILAINVISGIVYFREIILESSWNVSETTPWSLQWPRTEWPRKMSGNKYSH